MAKEIATPSSDLDLLVDLARGKDLFDLIGMKQEIKALAGLRVDIVTERNLSKYLLEKLFMKPGHYKGRSGLFSSYCRGDCR